MPASYRCAVPMRADARAARNSTLVGDLGALSVGELVEPRADRPSFPEPAEVIGQAVQ